MKQKKIGILGCAQIAPVAIVNPVKEIENLTVYGVAGRDPIRAKEYATQYGIPNVFESYDELLVCSEIDFVYIPLSNDLHIKWVVKSAEAKKHILVEKPISLNCEEFNIMEKACNDNGVHMLEAVMVQHHPWQQIVKEIISDKRYGKLLGIKTQITFPSKDNFQDNYRSHPEMGGGAFYDVGTYWLQFIQSILGLNPVSYGGSSEFNGANGCDWTFNAFMEFEDGVRSDFVCSFEMPNDSSHLLQFEKATVKIDDFFRAKFGNVKMTLKIENLETGEKEKIVTTPQNYYVNQLKFFSDVIDGIQENIPLSQSFERMKLLEEIYAIAKNRKI